MPKSARPWPTKARDVLDDTRAGLLRIDQLLRAAQVAARDGNRIEAVILCGDARNVAVTLYAKLTAARNGEYEKDDGDLCDPAR
ncbi:MAG TPA: hypothetical protein VNK95_03950 [Caldilineaceae bacterium]|nr:hypothetical protein [Caldilineaceae bacterium]